MSVFNVADILLPAVPDLTAWSVPACDQFTSQGEYWEAVEQRVGEAPSSLRLILPEAWLGTARAAGAEERIAGTMECYVNSGVFRTLPGSLLYLERRQSDGRVRAGLIGAVDLEAYDESPRSAAAVRPSEATVTERLPARIAVRAGALLELPHVLLLMDDPEDRVLGPLREEKPRLEKEYDFDLMLGGGHVTGWRVTGPAQQRALDVLDARTEPGGLLFLVGDGNHSLAAARRWWEQLRSTLPEEQRLGHPARYALVELENLHDPALDFAPIHRLILDTDAAAFPAALAANRHRWEGEGVSLAERVSAADDFCRAYIAAHGGRLDYIHGDETARRLGRRPHCGAVLLPPVKKEDLFSSVLRHGALPRKSFSMGQAEDKRYYLEARIIRDITGR